MTFEEACTAFDDPHALVQPDRRHHDRLLLLGASMRARVLFVVYAEREPGDVIRLISARKATRHERKTYEDE